MKRSELIENVMVHIEKLVMDNEEKGLMLTPKGFTTEILTFFENEGIIKPTYFTKDADDNIHQVDGFETEEE